MAVIAGNLVKNMVGPWGLEPQTSTVSINNLTRNEPTLGDTICLGYRGELGRESHCLREAFREQHSRPRLEARTRSQHIAPHFPSRRK
jgi:hypothetical protein